MLRKILDANSSSLARYEKFRNRFEPRVHISQVLPGSILHTYDLVSDGDVILKEINGVPVKTISDVHKGLEAGKGSPYIVLLTEGNKPLVLGHETIAAEEEKLRTLYPYLVTHRMRVYRVRGEVLLRFFQGCLQPASFLHRYD